MRTPAEQSAKKPYVPPRLLVYGDLTELTQTTGNNPKANFDGGTGKNHKTA
jgi:hypothetical protein